MNVNKHSTSDKYLEPDYFFENNFICFKEEKARSKVELDVKKPVNADIEELFKKNFQNYLKDCYRNSKVVMEVWKLRDLSKSQEMALPGLGIPSLLCEVKSGDTWAVSTVQERGKGIVLYIDTVYPPHTPIRICDHLRGKFLNKLDPFFNDFLNAKTEEEVDNLINLLELQFANEL